ncbi:MAG: prolyl oligopeptidase family serine peptidase [Gammaproteobacteria bacterium]|nr:prolyl oligopeptidase family serine peptidase [Gammaproteobacteria bacterium]
MSKSLVRIALLAVPLALSACGGSSTQTSTMTTSTARGTLVADPPLRIAALDATTLQADLSANASGAQLLQLTGAPACGVDFYYLKFWTVGGANEPTESSGALMVPTGSSPACSGPRPIVLYAHGTQTDKTANIADITNPSNSEGALIAAMFAAQGYIVVAPNYAGYDSSTLGYHPYVNAAQNSAEMIDALAAARKALPNTLATATSDNGKLFVTGYSEGGYVAMAAQREMIAEGIKVTAAAPMSGPYALEAFGDAIFFGDVNLGSTVFTPLITTSYQKAYGNIYQATTDVYSASYASGIETLLPSTTPVSTLFASGMLPETALFDSTTPIVTIPNNPTLSAELTAALAVPSNPNDPRTPLFAAGFGNPYLVNNAYRVSYALDAAADPDGAVPTPMAGVPLAAAAPTQTLRKALYLNDLRNGGWMPNSPTLMCGGDQDPTVFFSVNTGTMQAFWAATPAAPLISVLDVNATPAGPFAAIQTGFQTAEAAQLAFYESAAGGGNSPAAAQQLLVEGYHAAVAPFCALAARSFFGQF